MSLFEVVDKSYWDYEDGDDSITLDENYTIEELEKIIKYMKEHLYDRDTY